MKKFNLFLFLILFNIIYANENVFKSIKIESYHPAKENLLIVSNKYLNKKMDDKSIMKLFEELSNKLKDEGYITSNITMINGNVKTGNISFGIESGKIGKIYFSNSKENERKIKMAFNIKEGSEFNIKDLDQGIENLNIGGKNYKLEIVKSNNKGNYSDVIIHDDNSNYQKFINVSLDNSPSQFLNLKLDISTEKYNLFNLNDTLRINANTRLNSNIIRDFDSKINFVYTLPYGYSNYKYSLGLSANINKTKGINQDIVNKKFNINQKLQYSKILYKDKNQKTIFNTSLSLDKSYTLLNEQKIELLSLWDIYSNQSLSYNRQIENGAYNLKVEQEFGLNSRYFKALFDFNLDKNFFLKNNNILSYSLKGNATIAHSPTGLLDKKKISLGDESTVRGFKKISFSGEKGAYLNNTLTYRMKNTNFTPFVGLDVGIVKDSKLDDSDKLLGLAVGFSKKIKGMNVNLTLSKGFLFSKIKKLDEKYAFYFSVSKKF